MSWSKLFSNWTWHNKSTAKDTPLSAANLQKINDALDGADTRITNLLNGDSAINDSLTVEDSDNDEHNASYGYDGITCERTFNIQSEGEVQANGEKILTEPDFEDIMGDEWNSAITYAVGEVVRYNGLLYVCLVANKNVTPTNTTYWGETSVEGEIGSLNSNLSNKFNVVASTLPTITDGTMSDATFTYPTGFNKNNTMIMSIMVCDNSGYWRTLQAGSFTTTFRRAFVLLNSNNIVFSTNDGGISQKQFKISLMRTDI